VISIFRINDIIDLPVIDSTSAQRLCAIKDVIIDMRKNSIYALVCKERMFGRSLEAVPFKSVEAISQNGIWAGGRTIQINSKNIFVKQRYFQSYQNILGKLVQGSGGEELGIIRDILFDTNTGIIRAYELSEGYLDDFFRGRRIIELDSASLKEYDAQCLFSGKQQ
jgi:uncharacterized protein YrrD